MRFDREALPPASLDEMIPHDQALETYPWLSAQSLNRWHRDRTIRAFRGKGGKLVYPKTDLEAAMNQEMGCESHQDNEASLNIEVSGSDRSRGEPATIDIGTKTEADALREKLLRESIFNPRKKSSSESSGKSRPRPGTQEASL